VLDWYRSVLAEGTTATVRSVGWPGTGEVSLFDPGKATTAWYRYWGTKIPSSWPSSV
jgi:hypothetical protein